MPHRTSDDLRSRSQVVEAEVGKKYSSGRVGTALADHVKLMAEKNLLLQAKGHALMLVEELIAARLYTGPMVRRRRIAECAALSVVCLLLAHCLCPLPRLPQYEKFNLVLRFFTGASEYTAAELPNGRKSLPFLQVQCEAFLLGRWVETGDGGLRWEWDNSA